MFWAHPQRIQLYPENMQSNSLTTLSVALLIIIIIIIIIILFI